MHMKNAPPRMQSAINANIKAIIVHAATQKVSSLTADESLSSAFLDTLSSDLNKAWYVELENEIPFKLNTGAEVIAVQPEVYESLGTGKPLLSSPTRRLFGPAQHLLHVLGQGELHFKGRSATQQLYIRSQKQHFRTASYHSSESGSQNRYDLSLRHPYMYI